MLQLIAGGASGAGSVVREHRGRPRSGHGCTLLTLEDIAFDEVSLAPGRADQQYFQVAPGPNRGDLTILRLGQGAEISLERMPMTVAVRGVAPRRVLTLCMPADDDSMLRYRGRYVGPDAFVHLRPCAELDMEFRGSRLSLTIDPSDLTRALDELTPGAEIRGDVIRLAPWTATRLRTSLLATLPEVQGRAECLRSPASAAALRRRMLADLVAALPGAAEDEAGQRENGVRFRAARAAERLALENLHRPLSIPDLLQQSDVSERTLRNGFMDRFGQSPKPYLTALRLNAVHAALRVARPDLTTVTRAAYGHGFWHLGRFAGAYRRHFGESPSETLRRQPPRRAAAR